MSPADRLLATQLQAPTLLVPLDVAFALLGVVVLLPAVGGWRSRVAWRRAGVRAGVGTA